MSRTHGVIKPAFWTGATGRRLRGNRDAQALAAYLMTGPHTTMIGIFYLPLPYVSNDLGMTAEEARSAFLFLSEDDFAFLDADTDLVWVPNVARDQVGKTMTANDKRRPAVMRLLEPHLEHRFGQAFVAKYHEIYLLDVKPLPGEDNSPDMGHPVSRMPPYPVPVPDTAPDPTGGFSRSEIAGQLYLEVSGNTDLPLMSCNWNHKHREACTRMATWGTDAGLRFGDFLKPEPDKFAEELRNELTALKQDNFIAGSPIHVWAARLGTGKNKKATGAAMAPERYRNEGSLTE